MALAISSGTAANPRGDACAMASVIARVAASGSSSISALVMGVTVLPGATALTRIPRAASSQAAVYQTSWSLTAMPAWADDGSYTLWAEASDKAGNVQSLFSGNGSSVTFTTDKSAPQLAVLSPAASSKISAVASVTGAAYACVK